MKDNQPDLLAAIADNSVDVDVYHLTAVAEGAQLVEREERRTGKVRFHAQHAIKLYRMPDRFVDLQAKLRTVENDIECAFRALIRMMQSNRFFRNAAGVLHKL